MVHRLDPGSAAGGIIRLRDLLSEHPAEFAYDFRAHFGVSYTEIGGDVSWLEAAFLVSVLMRDPSSWIQAAINDWDHPVSREWIIAAHTYDLHAAINSKNKPKPYPAPWPDESVGKLGSRKQQDRSAVLSRLEQMNPKENDG